MDWEEAKQMKDLRAQLDAIRNVLEVSDDTKSCTVLMLAENMAAQLEECQRERDEWRALAEKRRQEVTKLDDMRERLSAENHRPQQWYDWADLLAAKARLKELEE